MEKKGKDLSSAEKSHSSSTPQQYKPLGKIDLDSIGRKPAAQKSSPKTDKPETHAKPQAKTAAGRQTPSEGDRTNEAPVQGASAPAAPTTATEKAENIQNQKPVVQKQENKQENIEPKSVNNAAAAEAATTPPADNQKSETTLFPTKSEKKIINTPKVNILGKIALSTLTQSTRPKKKSKEEKR